MNIVKSRGGMAAILAVLALAAVNVNAQAPGGGPPGGGPPRGMGMGGGMGGPQDRPTVIQRQGLNDPALKLTDAQKAQIDKIVDGYVAEQKTLAEKYPMTPGSPSASACTSRIPLLERSMPSAALALAASSIRRGTKGASSSVSAKLQTRARICECGR